MKITIFDIATILMKRYKVTFDEALSMILSQSLLFCGVLLLGNFILNHYEDKKNGSS